MTRFIAIDGEGDDRGTITLSDGTKRSHQDYTVLTSSLGEDTALYHLDHMIGEVRGRLDTYECLMWLTDLAIRNPDATFIGYGLSYDITMMLRDLSFAQLKAIHQHAKSNGAESFMPVQCGAFALRYVPRKFLEVTRFKHSYDPIHGHLILERNKRGPIRECKMVLWDTIGFFQTSFLKAIEQYALPVEDINFIRTMKGLRGTFEKLSTRDIVRYSTRECQILVQLMEKLEGYLKMIDVSLSKWGGAGYIASDLLKKHGVKDHLEDPPKAVLDASLIAFSGGRIELICYGHAKGPTYDYDINSCYPSAMVNFPSLAGGKWIHTYPVSVYSIQLIHVRWSLWDSDRRIYPFAYRAEDDSISYPSEGETWCWLPEYQAAMKHLHKYKGGMIDVLESYSFVPDSDVHPYSFITELAAKRLEWKKQFRDTHGTEGGQHIAVKLGLNSLFGKCVQQVGGFISNKRTTLPPFHSMVYGGNITSYGRATLYDAAMQNEDAVVMFATDGLFTTAPLSLDTGTGLGQWEETIVDELIIVQSGVYFSRKGDIWYKKTRGFMPDVITPNDILLAWKAGLHHLMRLSKRFVTFGLVATASRPITIISSTERLCTWEERRRDLSLTSFGTKRYNRLNDEYTTKRNAAHGLLATYPKINETPEQISKAYEYIYLKKWDELTEEQQDYLLEREESEHA